MTVDTPWQHTTVLLREAVDALDIKPDGIYVDATFGRGGHSRLILAKLSREGRLIALDRDPAAVTAAQAISDPRFHIEHTAFSHLRATLQAQRIDAVHGVLLD